MCALAGVLLAGCAPTPRFTGDSARQLFLTTLETLDDRYIEPIDPSTLMMSGLSQLSTIDERLEISRTPNSITLSVNGGIVAERTMPAPHDIHGWSGLAADMIVAARRESPSVTARDADHVYDSIFHGIVDGLDRYSRYLPPDDALNSRASREGFGGIGVQIDSVDGDFVIRTVYPDRPATLAGLKVDDRITHVDGRAVNGLDLRAVVRRLRGRVGDTVRLTIQRAGTPRPFDREIVRDYIVASTVTVHGHDRILEAKLTGFNTGTVGELRRAIVRMAREIGPGLEGVVLDLRGNPGGLLDQAIAVSDLFMTRGRIISTKGRHPESNQLFDASPGEVLPGVPMVVIVNGRSASAAEIVAVALRDSGRAAVVGSTTFGKGTVQTIMRLPNHGELNITWARIHAPSGQTLDAQGIVPAICTNISEAAAKTLLATLGARADKPVVDPLKLRLQARQPHYSADRREACRPSDHNGAHDLEAARLLLGNRALYASAIAQLPPTIAER